MLDTIVSRGIVSVIGGFLIALVIGTTYLWGIISIYITSYYRSIYDPTLGAELTAMVFPFMIFGQVILAIYVGYCHALRSQTYEKS